MNLTKNRSLKNWLGFAFMLLALAWWGWWGSHGWKTVGMVGHEFRQTQTALSIQAMQRDGFSIDYPTPVLGKPWSIPMEFPIYQYAVVKYCEFFGVGVIEGGRWVSVWCFVLGLPALVLLMREAGFSWGASAVGVIPVLTAPVYLFYSRTVMIESMAWAASAWFLVGVFRYRRSGTWRALGGALLAGLFAVLVKVTTWAAFCLPWAGLFLWDLWRMRKAGAVTTWRSLAVQAFGIGVPLLLVGYSWVQIADSIKEQNPLAHFLLSSELKTFNFGTWELRTDFSNLKIVLQRWSESLLPWWLIFPGFGLAIILPKSRSVALLGAVGFFGIQSIFFGLYFFHDYYFYANGAMLGVAVGSAAAVGWDARRRCFAAGVGALVLIVSVGAVQFRLYQNYLYKYQTAPSMGVSAVSGAMQEIVGPNEVVVAHSPDWSSNLAYYAERRMMMIPDAQMYLHPDRVKQGLDLLSDESTPLLLMMGESRVHKDWVIERIDDLGLWPAPLFTSNINVTAYARADRYTEMRQKLQILNLGGIHLSPLLPSVPEEDRMQFTGTNMAEQLAELELFPTSAYFPYGFDVGRNAQGVVLSTHAPTELYFSIPEGASRVRFLFGINPDSLLNENYDGVGVQLDLVSAEGDLSPFHHAWLSPLSVKSEMEVSVALPESSDRTLRYRVTGGPENSYAFDQAWLRSLVFE